MMHRPTSRSNGPGARVARSPAAERNVGQTVESTTTMTTKGGIVGRGGALVIWEARL
jgi:hypothetical protein